MNIEFTKSNILVIAGLLLFFAIGTFFGFKLIGKGAGAQPNIFVCANQETPFRANISDCLAFGVSPGRDALANTVANPTANRVAILIEPNASGSLGLAAFDIYKIYKSLEPRTNIVPGIAYTYHWPEQPLVPNITVDEATFNSPVIWLRLNQTENKIVVDGPKIYVNANSAADLDAAACLISIELIEKVLTC